LSIFVKNFLIFYRISKNLSCENKRVNECSDYIVESVSSCCYAEAANRKQRGEINARHCPEYEFRPVEKVAGVGAAGEKIDVVMGAEKSRRDQHRKNNRVIFAETENILKQQ
jgi:hypothetical protein